MTNYTYTNQKIILKQKLLFFNFSWKLTAVRRSKQFFHVFCMNFRKYLYKRCTYCSILHLLFTKYWRHFCIRFSSVRKPFFHMSFGGKLLVPCTNFILHMFCFRFGDICEHVFHEYVYLEHLFGSVIRENFEHVFA